MYGQTLCKEECCPVVVLRSLDDDLDDNSVRNVLFEPNHHQTAAHVVRIKPSSIVITGHVDVCLGRITPQRNVQSWAPLYYSGIPKRSSIPLSVSQGIFELQVSQPIASKRFAIPRKT